MTFKTTTTSAVIYSAVSAALFMGAASAGAADATLTTAMTEAMKSTAVTVQGRGVASGLTLPNRPIFALTSDNAIYVLLPRLGQYVRLGRVETDGGNLIGIDFRPADGKLYGLTDLGTLYTIDVSLTNFGQKQKVSTMNPRFTGGFENIMDFN